MAKMLPPSRPKQAEADTRALIAKYPGAKGYPVVLVGVRGYYKDTMGAAGKNDRGIYDDAIFVVTPNAYAAFNANTDPSVQRTGIASLVPGLHLYKKGKHGISRKPPYVPYAALRPATDGERLPVTRDGQKGESYGVAINIHKGGYNSTSSEGCQTIHPDQWKAFISLVYAEMDRHGSRFVPYILVNG